MTRSIITAVLTAALFVGTLSAQEKQPLEDHDPIANLTTRIIEQVFGTSAVNTAIENDEADQAEEDAERDRLEAIPLWLDRTQLDSVPAMPIWMMPRPATQALPRANIAAMQRQMAAITQLQRQKDAPLAFSAAGANGNYAIEAVIPTDDGPQKVKLQGTRAEIEDQFKELPAAMQRSLGPRLGMQ